MHPIPRTAVAHPQPPAADAPSPSAPAASTDLYSPKSPVLIPVLASLSQCEGARTRALTDEDTQRACSTPQAPKRRCADYASFGGEVGLRRATRAHLAGDVQKGRRGIAVQFLAMIPVFGTAALGPAVLGLGRWTYEKATGSRGQLHHRSPDAVREDVMLRALTQLAAAVRTYKSVQAFADPHQIAAIKARFAAMEAAMMNSPAARLRGSPELRGTLNTIAAELRDCYSPGPLVERKPLPTAVLGHWMSFE